MIGIDNYLATGSVKSAWVTLYVMFIVFGVVYMVRSLFDNSSDISDVETGDKRPGGGFLSRIGNTYNVLKDNILILLIGLTLNGFGTASTKALGILSWIYFVITIIYAIAVLFVDHKIIHALFNLVFFVLALIMTSLAFKVGW